MIDRMCFYGGFQIDCDICDEKLVVECENIDSMTVKNAIETARMYGWSIGKKNLCPLCKRRKRSVHIQ